MLITPTFEMNGGSLTIEMGSGDTDAVDSNGNLYINGGTLTITAQSPFDYDGTGELNGGTLIVNGQEVTSLSNQMMGGGQMGGGQMGSAPGGGRAFVESPGNLQEAVDMVYNAFDIADKYRCLVIILTDKMMAATKESVNLPELRDMSTLPDKSDWIISKRDNLEVSSRRMFPMKRPDGMPFGPALEQFNAGLGKQYEVWNKEEVRYEEYMLDDAEMVIFAYGSVSRIVKAAIKQLRAEGYKVGMFRPITVFPFPVDAIKALDYTKIKKALCVEMAIPGQLAEDVERGLPNDMKLERYGRSGGVIVMPSMVIQKVKELYGKE